ncbi:MAG TPA: permease prefix domain 1-containing protein [Kofleriaceae bacterium]
MSDDKELEAAVAAYREQLRAEADLGKTDLAEIEDHLRDLITELRDHGMPLAEATREAATRLGDPRVIAKEHARVRTPFGAKLPRWRAWIAAAAVIAQVICVLHGAAGFVTGPLEIVQLALGVGFAVGIVFGATWMRPIVLAAALWQSAWGLCNLWPEAALAAGLWPASVITAAMLLPWKRNELRLPAVALALLYFAFLGASWLVNLQVTNAAGAVILAPTGASIGFACVFVAGAGVVLRARWAAACSAVVAGVLLNGFIDVTTFMRSMKVSTELAVFTCSVLAGGAVCAAIASVVAWRTARSGIGTLRDVLA